VGASDSHVRIEGAHADELARAAVDGDAAALDAFYAALKERNFNRGPHFGLHLGVEVLEVAANRVVMRLPWRREVQRGGGIFHGGAIMALADHVAGCVFNTDPRIFASGTTGLTTDFSASFLRAAEPGDALVATGTVLRRGRNVVFMQVDVRSDPSNRAVAICRTTYVVVPRERVRRGVRKLEQSESSDEHTRSRPKSR